MNQNNTRLEFIQMLRGLAALFVVFVHIGASRFNGAFGVDIFFVISGFIMMYISQDRVDKFFLKRLIRISPLYYLYTFLWVALLLIIPSAFNTTSFNLSDLIKSLLFIPYYAENRSSPMLSVGWTLNYEMFFYLVFGMSMFISKRARGLVCSVIIIVLVIIGRFIQTDNAVFNKWTDTVLLEFLFGILAFYILCYLRSKTENIAKIYKLVSFVIFVGIIVFMPFASRYFPFDRFIIWGIPSLILFVASFIFTMGYSIPKPLVRLGDISFSLYLLHTFVIESVDHLIYPLHNDFNITTFFAILLAIFLCIVGSYYSWYFLEKHLTRKISERLFKQ